ncbi:MULTISPECIES: hypothetical protein [unclassified Cellvibrio]|uniref:hypothetical protein n=1 Tax=unclassified Cellvibrio TaxID=2624793 RepID=UPI00058EFBBD|nr:MULTISPECIES: hypothetical protein [unclassified Cellvibrio]QEY13705.1 hypothetical protein D0B88_16485 [Cellvibrio sp. KY-YJ-3]
MNSNDDAVLEAKIDGISKGLRMGMAEIYAQLLSFDKKNIEDDKPSFAYTFLQQQASEHGQTFDEFMDEQTRALEEYYEYRDAINQLYEVSDKYGYKEEK